MHTSTHNGLLLPPLSGCCERARESHACRSARLWEDASAVQSVQLSPVRPRKAERRRSIAFRAASGVMGEKL